MLQLKRARQDGKTLEGAGRALEAAERVLNAHEKAANAAGRASEASGGILGAKYETGLWLKGASLRLKWVKLDSVGPN